MSNWDLARTLGFELGLLPDMCERIVQVVAGSSEFVSKAEFTDAEEKWAHEIHIAECTIQELEEMIEHIREIIG